MARLPETRYQGAKRITTVATVLALAGGVACVPLGPHPIAHAQVAPTQQPGISHSMVQNARGDWEASVFFLESMTVRTVSIDFVPPDSTNPREEAPADDPVFTRIPEVGDYRVDHKKGTQTLGSYNVTAYRTQGTSTSGHPTIRITYELPGVVVGPNERLSLFAPGMGATYPTPLRGGGSRFSRPTVNGDTRGFVTIHGATEDEYKQTRVEIRQGADTFSSSVQADGSYDIAVPSPEGAMEIAVIPPAGFATPEPKTWQAAEGLDAPDFEVYPITVSGKLIDASGAPVQGASVTIGNRSATSDEYGNFVVTKVSAGTHDVVIGETTGTRGRTMPGITVSDQRDNQINDISVETKPQFGTVSGRVIDPSGVGVAGVVVRAAGRSATTDGDGRYSVAGVPTGSTSVAVDRSSVPEGYSVSGPLTRNVTTAGVSGVDFSTVRETGTVSGRVIDPSGVGVAGVVVRVAGRSATTDGSGRYSVAGVPTGRTTIEVSALPNIFLRPPAQEGNVGVGGLKDVDFDLEAKPTPTPTTTKATTPMPTTTKATTPMPTTTKATTPKPTPTTSQPAPSTTVASTTPLTTLPLPSYRWEPVVVKQGEVALADVKQQGATGGQKTGFTTVGVVKIAGDGNAAPVAPDESWIEVEADGTIVATPPAEATPGTYQVEIATPSGTREKVTVEVTPQPPMAQRYDVAGPSVDAPAGTVRTAPSLRAQVTEAGFVYDDRVLPAGTTFDVRHEWARVDANGRVTFSPPKDAKRGTYEVPLVINYPDGSRGEVTVTFVVGDPLYADLVDYGFETGLKVLPGRSVTILRTSDTPMPEGTTFKMKAGANLFGWSASVDEEAGNVRVTAPESGTSDVTVPVVAYFPDGSSLERTAGASVAMTGQAGTDAAPKYTATVAGPGQTVVTEIEHNQPEGAAFSVVDDGGLNVGVDKSTGALRITVPKDAQLDETYKVTVRVVHPDGSAEEVVAEVRTQSDAKRYDVDFTGANVPVGGEATQKPATKLPEGTRFSTDGFDKPGWDVTIDEVTGELTVSSTSDVPVGTTATVPVKVTYPDGSTVTVNVPVKAQSEGNRGSSIGGSWIAVLLGVLALLAGAGYGAWLNQDKIMEALRG